MYMSALGNIPSGRDRRGSARKATDQSTDFHFVFPLPSIITRMFGISDSGTARIKNVSKGGVMLEIPVTVKELTVLSHINKSLEMAQTDSGVEKTWALKSSDFSTMELNVPVKKKKSKVTLLALPVWVKYYEYSQSGGAIRMGLKFPETSQVKSSDQSESVETVLEGC